MPTSLKDKVDIAQSVLTCIAILVGGLWGVNEYLEKKQQDRISKSFEIVGEFRKSEDSLRYGEFADSKDVSAILRNKLIKSTEKSAKIAELHTPELQGQLMRAIDRYENAVACVTTNHCDKNVLAAFLAHAANSWFVIGHGVILEIRERRNDVNYAADLETVRDWYCTLPESADHKRKKASWCKANR